MPIYNVIATVETTRVVVADDENHAFDVALSLARDALSDPCEPYHVCVIGEVKDVSQLQDGWDGLCIPYGGDRTKRLSELLSDSKPEAKP